MVIRVLVVDDSASAIKRLTSQLESLGHDVIGSASSGEEAVAKCETMQPDVVMMDIKMPGMSGLEATKKILALSPDTAIIVVTAQGQEAILQDAIAVGARYYITKPFDKEQVKQALLKVIDKF